MRSVPPAVSRRRRRVAGPAAALAAALVVGVLACSSVPAGASTATPARPSAGSTAAFYATPSPLPSGPPGTVVREEPMTPPFAGARAWRVMYVSRGVADEPVVVTGMVFAPDTAAPAGSRPVVSWAHPTTGIVDACAPSRSRRPYADVQGLRAFVDRGWVVAATDYQGLGTDGPHPYLVGRSEAHGALDVVRAARNLRGTAAGTETLVWGHSQGGQAALFAANLAPTYAPELDLLGVAAAAPAGELVELFDADRDTFAGTALGALAIVSWSEVFGYDPASVVRRSLLGRTRAAARRCVVGASRVSQAALAVDVAVLKGRMWAADPATTRPWRTQFEANTPGPPASVPILVLQGSADRLVRPAATARLVGTYRAAGVVVTERTLRGVDHLEAGREAVPLVVAWATRLRG